MQLEVQKLSPAYPQSPTPNIVIPSSPPSIKQIRYERRTKQLNKQLLRLNRQRTRAPTTVSRMTRAATAALSLRATYQQLMNLPWEGGHSKL
jgi:hypothetical protein